MSYGLHDTQRTAEIRRRGIHNRYHPAIDTQEIDWAAAHSRFKLMMADLYADDDDEEET